MNAGPSSAERRTARSISRALLMLVLLFALAPAHPARAAANVMLWDVPAGTADTSAVSNRSDWKPVPTDLLTLEADPPKASSDPGYYGREYAFKGDAIVENRYLMAVFASAQGRVLLYAKMQSEAPAGSPPASGRAGKKVLECTPFPSTAAPARIRQCSIVRHAGDEVSLEVVFSADGTPEADVVFSFGRSEIVEIKPRETRRGVRLVSPLEYGIVPAFIGDDLILNPSEYGEAKSLAVPAENVFLGLMPGEENMLVMTWPQGKQRLGLDLSAPGSGRRVIDAVDFEHDGQSFYLAVLSAPGLWHREVLKPAYLEKDVAMEWKRPFPAKWTTQLYEEKVKTTFTFRPAKGQIWRGVPGSYNYPVWFEGETPFYHFSKKVPPKGESLIYCLESQDTPLSVSTPVDILKATLGRPFSDALLDVEGRKLRTHHRRGGEGVHRACTCGCTEAIQAIFEAGQEVARKEQVAGALGDMNYFVERHVARIEEYRRFADETARFLHAQAAAGPELKAYGEALEPILQQIPDEYGVQKENMKSAEYAAELTRQTLALTSRVNPNNFKAYMELLKAWRGMGGAQDYVVAQCHTITRKLFQAAGYGCLEQPKAIDLAKEIRARCRRVLRNPDGYEIWADY